MVGVLSMSPPHQFPQIPTSGHPCGPAYSAQFRGLDSAIRNPLLSSIFLTPKNPEVILEIIKFGFSEVSQIPSCLSQKIPLNSYDSNGVIRIFISALGDEKWELPISLFTR